MRETHFGRNLINLSLVRIKCPNCIVSFGTSEAYDDVAEANAEAIDKKVDGEVGTAEAEKKEGSDSESEDKVRHLKILKTLCVSLVEMGR